MIARPDNHIEKGDGVTIFVVCVTSPMMLIEENEICIYNVNYTCLGRLSRMNDTQILAVLQALAVGDSFGKTTEFASRKEICRSFSEISFLLPPGQALAHKDMDYGAVTDDTEQNLYLLEQYSIAGQITPEAAAEGLLRWYEESEAPQKYIGPSSAKAIQAIRQGTALECAGRSGTSCGGVMRAPAAFLCSTTLDSLMVNIRATLLPTHNTFPAMEAAMAYGCALWGMAETRDLRRIIGYALQGCDRAEQMYPEEADKLCAPRCSGRLKYLNKILENFQTAEELLDFLFDVLGTTISSCDVFTAAFALFLWAREDVFQSIRLSAMLGGDTDTIGCLAAVLCCVYAGGHNIPDDIVCTVCGRLDLEKSVRHVKAIREAQNR